MRKQQVDLVRQTIRKIAMIREALLEGSQLKDICEEVGLDTRTYHRYKRGNWQLLGQYLKAVQEYDRSLERN